MSVDDRVVAMSFENDKFNSGVNSTIGVIGRLKQSLNFSGAAKGLDDIQTAGNRVDLSHISGGVNAAKQSFSLLGTAAAVAMGNIAAKAITAGASLVKSFTLDPLIAGFHNYETQINAVQTIVANTGLKGAGGMKQVNAALQDLNTYANKTVYNFSEMARNIGTFTAAGVGLKTSEESIKGIANLAALSGSSSEQASSAMYQLSQAIAAGTVHLQDWNSVVNAGIGGQVFQKALFDTAKAMGTIKDVPLSETFDEWKKAGNSFRQSLSTTAKAATDSTSAIAKAQSDGAKAVKAAQQAAADSVAQAAQQVKDAQRGVSDASRQASQDIANAVQQQSDAVKQGALDVANALDAVKLARKQLLEAMKPPSHDELQASLDNLKTSKLDQADLANAVTLAQQEQTRAGQDLLIVEKQLADLEASGTATPDQILQAQRAVQDAQQRVKDDADAVTRAQLKQRAATRGVDQAEKDLQTTREQGTKKDKNVQNAQDALTAALQKYRDVQVKAQQSIAAAEQNVRDTKIRSSESQAKAGEQLAQAEKGQAKAIRDAQQQIVTAHEQAAAQINAAEGKINKKPPSSWLTSGVLTNTLQQFAGDMSTAQLKAQGFTDAQVKQIEALGKTASGAATNIKTMSQLTTALKEEVATAWSAIFKTIFGNIGDATKTFSAVHIVLENALTNPLKDLNKLLEGWVELGGRTAIIDSIKNVWKAFGDVLGAVKAAWKDIFPATTAQNLATISQHIEHLTAALIPSKTTIDEIKRIFEGLFAVLDIGKHIIVDVIHVFENLFGVVAPAGGGFLSLAANVGDFLKHIDDLVKKGTLLTTFFGALSAALHNPASLFHIIAVAITGLFSGFDPKSSAGISGAIGSITDKLPPLQKITDAVSKAWDKFVGILQNAVPIFTPLIQGLGNLFGSIVTFLTNSLQNMDFGAILHAIDTGLLVGIFVLFKKFFSGGGLKDVLGGGIFSHINDALEGVTGTLKAMQTQLKATALLEIAAAIGILAGSLVLLSTIPAAKMNSAMTAMTLAMGSLVGVMAILNKIGAGAFGAVRLTTLALGLIAVAGAVGLLAISVKELSDIDSKSLERGLIAVGVLLGEISLAMGPISSNSAGMISAGIGIAILAGALVILSHAVKDFGRMDLPTLGKGLAAVGGALLVIGTATKAFPPGLIGIGLGLLAISAGIKVLVGSIVTLGDLKMSQLAQGLFGIAGALGVIALAMHSMPPGMALQAAGLLLIAVALQGIVRAVDTFGKQSMDTIAKGLLALAGALVILAGGLTLMEGALPGAAALIVAAGALALLTPALILLGHQDIGTIVTALAALAGAMTVLGVASLLLEPAAPAMLALGVAMLALGAAMALIGAGVFLVGTGLSAIAVSGPIAIGILLKALENFVEAIPKVVEGIVTALLSIVTSLAKAAPQFVVAIGQILVALGQAVIKAAPIIANAFGALVQGALKVIRDNFPDIIKTGLDMLVALLSGIEDHISSVAKHAIGIVTKFLNTLADNLPDIVKAGANMLVKFLGGIADNIGSVVKQGGRIIAHFIQGIADSLKDIIKAGANVIATMIVGLGSIDKKIAIAAGHAIASFITGLADAGVDIIKAGTKAATKFLNALVTGLLTLTNEGAKAMIRFLNGVADAIHKYERQIFDAGWNIAWAIVQGMVQGFGDLAHRAVSAVEHLITSLPGKALKLLGISSPSKVFYDIGTNIVQGLTNGISDNADVPATSVQDMMDNLVNSVQTFPQQITDALDFSSSPTITPVLDLTQLQQDAATIPDIVATAPVSYAYGAGQAALIAAGQQQDPFATDTPAPTPYGGGAVQLVQNNYSPEALSDVQIYRQTNNLISQIANPASTFSSDARFFNKTGG